MFVNIISVVILLLLKYIKLEIVTFFFVGLRLTIFTCALAKNKNKNKTLEHLQI